MTSTSAEFPCAAAAAIMAAIEATVVELSRCEYIIFSCSKSCAFGYVLSVLVALVPVFEK